MKYMGKETHLIRIEIFHDRSRGALGLSQKRYISKILERFNMATMQSLMLLSINGTNSVKGNAHKMPWKRKVWNVFLTNLLLEA